MKALQGITKAQSQLRLNHEVCMHNILSFGSPRTMRQMAGDGDYLPYSPANLKRSDRLLADARQSLPLAASYLQP